MNTNRHEFFGTVLIFDRFASTAARDVILNEVEDLSELRCHAIVIGVPTPPTGGPSHALGMTRLI